MTVLARFLAFLQQERLLADSNAPTLLAFSGGIDSVVMAHLFRAAGLPFGLAHCNFQLRGAESDEDAHFAEMQAQEMGVPIHVQLFDTEVYADKRGLSIQVAARQLRYEWFETLRQQYGYARIATGHHQNDTAETVLLNLTRGAGLSGLGGIPQQNGVVIRPLLCLERADIAAYAQANALQWREDSSNLKTDYARNHIRHEVIPPLQQLNPNFIATLAHHAGLLRDTGANHAFLMQQYATWQTHPEGLALEISKMEKLPAPAPALYECLKPYGFSPEQARQLAANLSQAGFTLTAEHPAPELPPYCVLVDRQLLLLTQAQTAPEPAPVSIGADDLMLRLPQGGVLFCMPGSTAPPYPDGQNTIVVDADLLQFPLQLRPWRAGDRFQPFGMSGHKKLQDFFTDLKQSRFEKKRALILENGDGNIIWVLGHRMDGRFKLTPHTTAAALFRYEPSNHG